MIYFLNQQKRARQKTPTRVAIAKGGLEKVNLAIGFVPLNDCAPLVVAQEKGLFQKHGLEQVTLVREPGWKTIWEGIRSGRLDAALVVAGIPLASTLGVGGVPVPLVTALTVSRGGNAITFGRRLLLQAVQSPWDLRQYLRQTPDTVHTLGVVHPASMHNFLLRYWLASGGVDPDRDVTLTVIPPPQMVAHLKAGNIDGYCVGEPWNSRAVREQVGVIVATTPELLPSHIEKVLAVRQDWAQSYPRTHVALVKALLEACHYCDQPQHRPQILEWLAQPQYVGLATTDLEPGWRGILQRGIADESQVIVGFHQFANGRNTCPERLEHLWILTQMARWGLCAFPRNWVSVLDQVLDDKTYALAARELGLPDRAHDRGALLFADGSRFDGEDPLDYLESVAIRQELKLQEYPLSKV